MECKYSHGMQTLLSRVISSLILVLLSPLQRELLGLELRDVFDAHPAQHLAPEDMPKLSNMVIFTDKVCGWHPYPKGENLAFKISFV